jgi:hypothetical protein
MTSAQLFRDREHTGDWRLEQRDADRKTADIGLLRPFLPPLSEFDNFISYGWARVHDGLSILTNLLVVQISTSGFSAASFETNTWTS